MSSTLKQNTEKKIRRARIVATGALANQYWLNWLVDFWIPFAGFESKDEEAEYADQLKRSIAKLSDEANPDYWQDFRKIVGFLIAITHSIGEYRSGTKSRANLEVFEGSATTTYGLFASFQDVAGTGKFVNITVRPKDNKEPSLVLEFDAEGKENVADNPFSAEHPFGEENSLGDLAQKACQFVGQQPPVISLTIPILMPILASAQ